MIHRAFRRQVYPAHIPFTTRRPYERWRGRAMLSANIGVSRRLWSLPADCRAADASLVRSPS